MGSPRASQMSIMLIGDDERMLRVMSWILLEAGYYLWKCHDIDEAMRYAAEMDPAVIIIDVPRDAGPGGLVPLRKTYLQARVIAIHDHAPRERWHVAAESHLHRPFDAEDLLAAVDAVLKQEVGTPSSHDHS